MNNSNNINKSASDTQITEKINLEELDLWISFLNSFSDEYTNLVTKASNSANKEELKNQLLNTFKNNETILNDIVNYKRATHNFIECIDLECDSFYRDTYTKIKKAYRLHFQECNLLNKKVFFRVS
ncbi:hypothetical protein [Polaribacter glomeratus]|uniref:Uncharacterized protein n=1 Tax=Polaribacter glomeratus TaxID=102 RepID=A0A2S7WUS4_9FLAO|nr:hypothetical protein [Polaribacter glomeratus]PQJ81354.1 hypothetical protein BTO16_01615 [Polaribacter glomeratus]TXD64848.1 hypothetical protein ESX12_13625 [Polaribacter glomeratus]